MWAWNVCICGSAGFKKPCAGSSFCLCCPLLCISTTIPEEKHFYAACFKYWIGSLVQFIVRLSKQLAGQLVSEMQLILRLSLWGCFASHICFYLCKVCIEIKPVSGGCAQKGQQFCIHLQTCCTWWYKAHGGEQLGPWGPCFQVTSMVPAKGDHRNQALFCKLCR